MSGEYLEKSIIRRQQREMEIKKRLVIALAAITIVLFFIIIMQTSISSTASDSSHIVNYKYYKSVEIKKGDTLWSIANEYIDYNEYENIDEYIKEIMKTNSLKSSSIKAGRYLIIPYYSTQFKQG